MVGSTPQPGAGNCLRVSRAEDAVLIQVIGLGNMLLAPTLQAFVEGEVRSGFRNFIVDLRECTGMDSTFMGTFIGLTSLVKNCFGWFCLVHVSDENMRLLKMLGVIHMVSIHRGEFPTAENGCTTLHATRDPYAQLKQIHSAHKQLLDADPENKKRFEDFIRALEKEMAGAGRMEEPEIPIILPPPGSQGKPREKHPNE